MISLGIKEDVAAFVGRTKNPPRINLRPPPKSARLNSIRDLVRGPYDYRFDAPLEDTFLENLIQENIISRNNPSRGVERGRQVRAFYSTLSDDHKRMFSEIVKSLLPNKEKIGGVVWSGGAMRVVSESAATVTLDNLFEVLGIVYATEDDYAQNNPLTLWGTSAGSFQQLSFAARAPQSCNIRTTTQTDFSMFHNRRRIAQNWIDVSMSNGVKACTGKVSSNITHQDLQDLGMNPQVVVGYKNNSIRLPSIEKTGRFSFRMSEMYLGSPFPIKGAEFPKQSNELLGYDKDEIPLAWYGAASHNLPFLYYSPLAMLTDCGGCHLGGKVLFDAGIADKYNVYLESIENEITAYRKGQVDKPKLYFVIDNKRGDESKFPEDMFGRKASMFDRALYSIFFNSLDKLQVLYKMDTLSRLEKIGISRSFISTECRVNHPTIEEEYVSIHTAGFTTPPRDRETVVAANIPTKEFANLDFTPVIEQLHANFVDSDFIQSSGLSGLSAYDLYLSDISHAASANLDK